MTNISVIKRIPLFNTCAKFFYHNFLCTSPKLLMLAYKLGLISFYQPMFGESTAHADRTCADRWAAIHPYLPNTPYSFLDVGSQIGYFTFAAAEDGAVAIGIERHFLYISFAQTLKMLKKISNACFLKLDITPKSAHALPQVNVLCCLSVFHHWVVEHGFEKADQILDILAEKSQAIIFETGQSDECTVAWAKHLEFMGQDPSEWIISYLKKKGFYTVVKIGEFNTHLSHMKRGLFYGKK